MVLALAATALVPADSASAAPIDGLWLVSGSAIVEFTPTGPNAFQGTVRVGTYTPCGDPGTMRRGYLHEGWTITLRCD